MAFPEERFSSAEELIKSLAERSDDFDHVEIMVPKRMVLEGPGGEKKLANDCCSMIFKFNGESILMHYEDLERLLNDGVLSRMKIPIRIVPSV